MSFSRNARTDSAAPHWLVGLSVDALSHVGAALGVIGALLGGFLFGLLGITAGGLLGSLITATVGAIVLLALLRIVQRGSR